MQSKDTHYLKKYQDVVDLILKGYSNDQLLRRTFQVEGETLTLSKPTLITIRDKVKAAKADGSLSGIFDFLLGDDPQADEHYAQEKYRKVPERLHEMRRQGDVEGMLMEARIAEATMKTENRFLKEKIDELRSQLTELRQSGLGNVDTNIEYQFLKKDYQQLNDRHTEDTKELINLREENQELMAKSSDLNRIKELVEMGTQAMPIITQLLPVINPQLGAAMQQSQLAGVGQPAIESETQRQALAVGSLVMSSFQGVHYQQISVLLEQLRHHVDLLPIVLEDLAHLVQAERKNATSLDNEENIPSHAQTI